MKKTEPQRDLNASLLQAAELGILSEVKKAIKLGADIECKDESSSTPLFIAVANGHVKIVNFLIAAGASVNTIGCDGYSLLQCAANAGRKAGPRLIKTFAFKHKLDPNRRAPDTKATPLILAILSRRNSRIRVSLLLKAGANPNLSDYTGHTPLHWAAERQQKDVIRELLKFGANKNLKTLNGETAREIAQAEVAKAQSILKML